MNWNLLIEQLGWTLVHSIWQISLVAIAAWAVLRSIASSSANLRCTIAVAALAISVLLPMATFFQISEGIRAAVVHTEYEISDAAIRSGERSAAVPVRASEDNGPTVTAAADSGFLGSILLLRQFVSQSFPSGFPLLVALWILGVAVCSARFAGGIYALRRYRDRAEPVSGEWTERFASLCKRLKVGRPVELIASNIAGTPIAIGILKPMIVVPAAVFLQMHPSQLESIIAHELIHIRRLDPAVNLLQSAAEVLFFYHPGIWWLSTAIRREREFATDAAVVEECLGDRVVYARALADLEEIRLTANIDAPSIATAANGGNLMLRIQRILQKNAEMTRANSAWSTVAALALISAVLLAVFLFEKEDLVNAQTRGGEKKLAIGFVSIPPVDRSENPPKDSFATAQLLIEVLKSHRVPATGFVNGSQVSDGEKIFPVRAEIVKMWREAGLDVGVGGFKHIWFYETPFDNYVANVEKNEAVVKKIFSDKIEPQYFSYPFLNTGKSVEDRDRFESWLKGRGLTPVKYTIDNNEWMYSYAYDMARNDNDINTMKEVRAAFLIYIGKMFDHFESYSREMFGRDIPQTMVLTPSRLVADSGHDLLGMIEKRGYRFVPMSDAQSDPAYQTAEDFTGKSGISWFERWQMKAGKPLLDEPNVDATIQRIWEANKNMKAK